mmetsp:Transcript_9923/g.14734  ORF Transcript_9923/g.14734 Transcript_9923/m.14734 type:complete len:85 (-) Transcript_9923:2031-2285(-)
MNLNISSYIGKTNVKSDKNDLVIVAVKMVRVFENLPPFASKSLGTTNLHIFAWLGRSALNVFKYFSALMIHFRSIRLYFCLNPK